MFRDLVLAMGTNPVVKRLGERYGMALGASRFVSGESLSNALQTVRYLNRQGIYATIDHLGEGAPSLAAAEQARDEYLEVLARIHQEGHQSTVSVKLSMLGSPFGLAIAEANVEALVERAAGYGTMVRIDMEGSAWTSLTLDVYRRLAERYSQAVGIVLQAYLYRTREDLERLPVGGANVRVVKGAYQEPPRLAYANKSAVDANYLAVVERSLELGNYTAIATHDTRILDRVRALVTQRHLDRDQFEFQMLYGIRFAVLQELARQGFRTRVYVPYGKEWYAYYVRRLAERPANLMFFLRALTARSGAPKRDR